MARQPAVSEEEYMEVKHKGSKQAISRVVIEHGKQVADADRAIRQMRKNVIVMFDVKELRKNNDELKACLNRVKKNADEIGYRLAFVDENWLLLYPPGSELEEGDVGYTKQAV